MVRLIESRAKDSYLLRKRTILCIRTDRSGKQITTDNQRKKRNIKYIKKTSDNYNIKKVAPLPVANTHYFPTPDSKHSNLSVSLNYPQNTNVSFGSLKIPKIQRHRS